MTTEVSSLAISVDSRQVTAADAALQRFAVAGARAEKSITGTEAAARSLGSTLAGVVSALSVAKVVQYADAYQQVNARLRLVTDGQAAYNRVQAELVQLANETRVSLTDTIDLYGRIARSTKSLAASDTDRLRVTEAINKALIVSGASGASAQAALIQLGQGLASGTLRGEELNSILEQTPRLAEAIANGIGKNVGELRKFAAEGRLTSAVVFDALLSQAEVIDREFGRIPITIGQALQVAENNLQQFVGGTSEASGAGRALATIIVTLSENIDVLAAAAAGFGTAKLAQVFLGAAAAAKTAIAASLANVEALTAQRVAATAAAAAEAQRTSSVVAAAAAERAAAAAKLSTLDATRTAILQARAEAAARLQAAQATLAQASAQVQAARSAGALSSAIAARQAGELAVAAAQARQAAAVKELATLGRQQASVQAGITSATAAQTAATAALTTATTAQSAAQRALAGAQTAAAGAATVASRALGLLGGPIGAITTLLSLGATAWVLWGNNAEESSERAGEALRRNLGKAITDAQSKVNELDRQIRTSLDAGFASDSSRVRSLEQRRDALLAEIDAARNERSRIDAERERNDRIERNERARRVDPVAIRNRQQEALGEFLKDNATDAEKFAAAVKKAKAELGDLFTPELEARLRKRFFSKGAKGETPDVLGFDLDQIRSALDKLTSAYASAEQILEAQRAAGRLSDEEYYSAKLGFIRLSTEAQIAALDQENKRLAAQKGNAAELLKNQKEIAGNEVKIAILRAQGAAQAEVLATQQEAAADAIVRSLQEARAAAEEYVESLRRAQEIEVAGRGLGNQGRERLRQRQAIEERYLEQRQRLAAERRQNQITEERFRQELSIIDEFQRKALAQEDEGYRRRLESQRDFNAGAREALQNYLDQVRDINKQVEDLFTNALKSAEDKLVDFFRTGKLDVRGFFDGIFTDLTRIIVREQITGPLSEILKGGFGGAGGAGGGLGGLVQSALGGLFGGGFGAPPSSAPAAAASAGAAATAQAAATAAITTAQASSAAAITSAVAASSAAITAAQASSAAAISSAAAASDATSVAAVSGAVAAASAAELAAIATSTGSLVGAISASTTAIVTAISASAAGKGAAEGLALFGNSEFGDLFDFAGAGMAIGGQPRPRGLYPVNERGPELLQVGGRNYLMMGSRGGKVMPLSGSVSGGETSLTINQMFAPGTTRATADQAAAAQAREARRVLARKVAA